MMNIEELRKIFCEDGLYAVCVENKNKNPPKRVKCGCVEDACHIRGGEGFLPRRVSYSSGS